LNPKIWIPKKEILPGVTLNKTFIETKQNYIGFGAGFDLANSSSPDDEPFTIPEDWIDPYDPATMD